MPSRRFAFFENFGGFSCPAILYPLRENPFDILSAGQTGGLIVREITDITHFELDPFFGGVYELSGYR